MSSLFNRLAKVALMAVVALTALSSQLASALEEAIKLPTLLCKLPTARPTHSPSLLVFDP